MNIYCNFMSVLDTCKSFNAFMHCTKNSENFLFSILEDVNQINKTQNNEKSSSNLLNIIFGIFLQTYFLPCTYEGPEQNYITELSVIPLRGGGSLSYRGQILRLLKKAGQNLGSLDKWKFLQAMTTKESIKLIKSSKFLSKLQVYRILEPGLMALSAAAASIFCRIS